MKAIAPENLGYNITLIDDFDLGTDSRTGTYVLKDEELTLIETSASPSVPYIIEGLHRLNISLEEIRWIIVTHIHLDHAGGAGLLLEKCPNAKVVVHPRGERHLADPSKLIAGARAVYGEKFDKLFNPIIPVPQERLVTKKDGDVLLIGERTLTFYDTPGHAKHHFSIHDSKSNGMFTGDTIGVQYPRLKKDGVHLYLPSTSPNQFDPDAMLHSLQRIEDLSVERIFFGHFSVSEEPLEVYRQIKAWLPNYIRAAEQAAAQTNDFAALHAMIREQLTETITAYLREKGIPDDHVEYDILHLDIDVCAMGLADYILKKS